MKAQELNTYISKVLGNSIRCLLPSYWWKRLLTLIVDYVGSVDTKVDGNAGRVDSLEKYVKSKTWITITTNSEGSAMILADEMNIEIAANSTKKVHFINIFLILDGNVNIDSIDTSMVFTSNVTGMAGMFFNCRALTSLDLSSFDTSKVTNMGGIFANCDNIAQLSLGEGFFKTREVTEVNFRYLENWSQDSFIQSVVTNSYDRASNGLSTLTINLHANTYAYLTDEHKATLTAKGYDVVQG